jgi:hypothetical protein
MVTNAKIINGQANFSSRAASTLAAMMNTTAPTATPLSCLRR